MGKNDWKTQWVDKIFFENRVKKISVFKQKQRCDNGPSVLTDYAEMHMMQSYAKWIMMQDLHTKRTSVWCPE